MEAQTIFDRVSGKNSAVPSENPIDPSACGLACDFCEGLSNGIEFGDRFIKRFGDDFTTIATVGCFREGYCLCLPKAHTKSFALLGADELRKAETHLEALRAAISDEFGTPVILAEHGAGLHNNGASCCDHAHIHLIPVNNPRDVFMQFYNCSSKVEAVPGLAALSSLAGLPYIYLSCGKGQHLVWRDCTPFGRQFVRRVCAQLDGIGPLFNWRVNPFYDRMKTTATRMRAWFAEREGENTPG